MLTTVKIVNDLFFMNDCFVKTLKVTKTLTNLRKKVCKFPPRPIISNHRLSQTKFTSTDKLCSESHLMWLLLGKIKIDNINQMVTMTGYSFIKLLSKCDHIKLLITLTNHSLFWEGFCGRSLKRFSLFSNFDVKLVYLLHK